jgi:hypothetical protein
MLPFPTAYRLARREALHTVALSTTRSATAATALLQPVWQLARILWPPAVTTLVRATAARAVVAQVVSLCTPLMWLRSVGGDWQELGKQNTSFVMRISFLTLFLHRTFNHHARLAIGWDVPFSFTYNVHMYKPNTRIFIRLQRPFPFSLKSSRHYHSIFAPKRS